MSVNGTGIDLIFTAYQWRWIQLSQGHLCVSVESGWNLNSALVSHSDPLSITPSAQSPNDTGKETGKLSSNCS